MLNDLSNQHGYRNIWPFIPIYKKDWEAFVDRNLYSGTAVNWLDELAQRTPSEDEIRILKEALAVSPDDLAASIPFDPNSISQCHVIAPLYKLGLISNEDIAEIIEKAELNFGISAHAGTTTITTLIERASDANGIKKSPGLKVLDDLLAAEALPPSLAARISERKAQFIHTVSTGLKRAMLPEM